MATDDVNYDLDYRRGAVLIQTDRGNEHPDVNHYGKYLEVVYIVVIFISCQVMPGQSITMERIEN